MVGLGEFQSAPPAREATRRQPVLSSARRVSIRASRAGGDEEREGRLVRSDCFNPRLPRGRRLRRRAGRGAVRRFNPRLPRGRRRQAFHLRTASASFNPRLPRGRRPSFLSTSISSLVFQSAPPAREATSARPTSSTRGPFQSAPPAREATPCQYSRAVALLFQSAPPAREATPRFCAISLASQVSIRASRAGGDRVGRWASDEPAKFQSAPPAREATTPSPSCNLLVVSFNPRLPRGRRLHGGRGAVDPCSVSIRASPRGRRLGFHGQSSFGPSFNPRLPRGRRLDEGREHPPNGRFQSAPPAREATS